MDAQRPIAGPTAGTDHVELLRRWVLGLLVLGLVGTVTELLLLGHYEQPMQLVPIVLIAIALAVVVWHVLRHDTASLRTLQVVMALFVLAGFAGVAAHFHGSVEFQLDLNPDMSTWELVEKVLRAKAPPVLAPGMMLQFGLLGLAYAYSDARYRPRVQRLFGFLLRKE
jgi:predicted membrane channel-forming protein YqfA (hemolysin III family)